MSKGRLKATDTMVGYPIMPAAEEYLIKPLVDSDGVQATSGIGPDGKEYPDNIPMSPPIGYVPPSDMLNMLEQLFQRSKALLEAAEIETEEEANDFEIEDDPIDTLTPYEKVFEPPQPAPGAAPSAAPSASSVSSNGSAPAAAGGSPEPPPAAASGS